MTETKTAETTTTTTEDLLMQIIDRTDDSYTVHTIKQEATNGNITYTDVYIDDAGCVIPRHLVDGWEGPVKSRKPTVLHDMEIIRRPGRGRWLEFLDDAADLPESTDPNTLVANCLREIMEAHEVEAEVINDVIPEDIEVTDITLRMVSNIIDPEGTTLEDDLATRLTSLFTSDEFNQRNFPELPGAHIRRLRWIARARGFNSVREVLVAVSDGPRMKRLRGLSKAEVLVQLDIMLNRRGLIKPETVASLRPIIDAMGRSVREKNRKISRWANKSHRGSLYTNRTILVWSGSRVHFTREFGAPSLLEHCIESCYGQQSSPVAFQILNQDPERKPLPKELIHQLNSAGILVIKEKAAVPVISDWVPMGERAKLMEELWVDGALNMDLVNRRDKKGRRYITPGAKWLMLTFDKSIDATYIPSLVTAPIEPSSFMKTKVVYAECCDHQGSSMGMDGGGWVPPFVDGKKQTNHQIRGMGMVDTEGTLAYIKGEAFVKWDACIYRDTAASEENGGGAWYPLWTDYNRSFVTQSVGMTDEEFRKAYWAAAKACTDEGYPKFKVGCIEFQMVPVIDYDQVKGKAKKMVRDLGLEPTTAFMGALRRETGFSTMSFCFEGQQFTKYQPGVDNDPSKWTPAMKAINSAQDELVERILDEGEGDKERLLDGLASRAAAQDEGIRTILSTLEAFNARIPEDKQVYWWNIPTLRSRIWSSLERLMYRGGDGGGIQCPQVVYQMCQGLDEGKTVYTAAGGEIINDEWKGQEVMTYRFPMSTHTALCVVKTDNPMSHPELWEDPWGYVSPHRMVMNPNDLSFRMQGDDDGDKGGATTDPDIIAMAKDTWETRPVDIEVRASTGTDKYDEPMWSVHLDIPVIEGVPVVNPKGDDYQEYTSGMELAARSRRGQVGRTTRLQQRLDAMKWQRAIDEEAKWIYKPIFGERAIAMAWPNQGEIDCEKKLILPIDMRKVFTQGLFEQTMMGNTVVAGALIKDEDDIWRINPELVSNEAGRYDVDGLSSMVKAMLIAEGCCIETCQNEYETEYEVGDPIEWCRSDKRVDLTSTSWEGSRIWRSGGLEIDSIMHWSFRNMEAKWWAEIAPVLGLKPGDDYGKATSGGNVDMSDLLYRVMVECVDPKDAKRLIRRNRSYWSKLTYKTMRTITGAEAYAKSMADSYRINDVEDTEEARSSARARAATKQQEVLAECSLQDYIDLWFLEGFQYERLMSMSERAAIHGDDLEARKYRDDAEKCINSMVRLINFPESKVARILGVTEAYECAFLTKERAEDIVAECYDRRDRQATFTSLQGWVKANGHLHTHVQGPDARPVHMTACPHCMDEARKVLVRSYRKDANSATADYFKDLISSLNGTGEYEA